MKLPPPPPEPVFHVLPLGGHGGGAEAPSEPPPAAEIAGMLDGLDDTRGPVWVDVARTHPRARDVLRSLGITDDITLDALLMQETRPRAWSEGEALVAFLRGVNLNADARPEDMISVRVWMTRDRLVTLRVFRVMALESSAERVRTGRGEGSTTATLLDLIRGLTERLESTIEGLEAQVLETEQALSEQSHSEGPGERLRLAPIRRKVVMLRRYVSPQRDLLTQLSSSRFTAWFTEDDREQLRELESRQARLVEELDELRERAQVLIEEAHAAAGHKMAQTSYVLTVVAALFLPLGFLTGLLGVNVGGIPGVEEPTAFWVLCGLMVLLVVAQMVVFRWRKWL
ncbi:MAG: zinc transporter ZntB [Planctomycetota bacterium]